MDDFPVIELGTLHRVFACFFLSFGRKYRSTGVRNSWRASLYFVRVCVRINTYDFLLSGLMCWDTYMDVEDDLHSQ